MYMDRQASFKAKKDSVAVVVASSQDLFDPYIEVHWIHFSDCLIGSSAKCEGRRQLVFFKIARIFPMSEMVINDTKI